MKPNPFALAAAGISPEHPLDYNIALPLLPAPFLEAIVSEINAGTMSYYQGGAIRSGGEPLMIGKVVSSEQVGLMPWIKRCDAETVHGVLQHENGDEIEDIFIPTHAHLPVSYFLEDSDREAGVLTPNAQQAAIVSAARQVGALEERLCSLPPAHFNITLERVRLCSPLRTAAEQGRLHVIVAGGHTWVSEEEVQAFFGPNVDIDDFESDYWVPYSARHHRVVFDLERELAVLHSHWPEIFERRVPFTPRLL